MKAIVLFSGGIDSTTCLALAIEKFGKENVTALSITYGQKHSKELAAAKSILNYYELEGMELDLTPMFAYSDCSLLNHSKVEIPQTSYAEQLEYTNGKPVSTYVPFRNGLFLSSAASIALAKGCSSIYYGAHSDDTAGNAYPDCSQTFNEAINRAIYEGSGKALQVVAPFVGLTKADVVSEGLCLNVPYHLTWSCYEGHTTPCRECGTCIDREKAFKLNGLIDPLLQE